jgi:hypothetical protein
VLKAYPPVAHDLENNALYQFKYITPWGNAREVRLTTSSVGLETFICCHATIPPPDYLPISVPSARNLCLRKRICAPAEFVHEGSIFGVLETEALARKQATGAAQHRPPSLTATTEETQMGGVHV